MSALPEELIQGSEEWLSLRKTKITATDASVIMGASHWKTRIELYHEKLSDKHNTYRNDAMQRGIDLEPLARDLFTIQTGIVVEPKVVVKDWAMASLDGISDCGRYVVEIKCPNAKDHAVAVSGRVPDHYYPQLQHQMYVCDVDRMTYFSFDGADGVPVEVIRDDEYIKRMIDEEYTFYRCLQNKTPPEPSEGDYIERNDTLWENCASRWKDIAEEIKDLEKQEQELRRQLIFLSGEANTKGGGISLCQIKRKGHIDYSKIPEIKGINLEKYRKEESVCWRIMIQ